MRMCVYVAPHELFLVPVSFLEAVVFSCGRLDSEKLSPLRVRVCDSPAAVTCACSREAVVCCVWLFSSCCKEIASVCVCVCVCAIPQQLLHVCSCLRWRPTPFRLHRSGGCAGEESSELAPWERDHRLSQPSQLGEAVPAPVPEPYQPSPWRINHPPFKCQYSPFCLLPPVMWMRRRQQILRLCVSSLGCCSVPACRVRLCAWLGMLPRCSRE